MHLHPNLCSLCQQIFELSQDFFNHALYHKYTELPGFKDYYYISNIINNKPSLVNYRFKQQQYLDDRDQYLKRIYMVREFPKKIAFLSQHYRYHLQVPKCHARSVEPILQKYLNHKLKAYYNKIKKALNMSIEQTITERSDTLSSDSIQQLQCSCVLCQITKSNHSKNVMMSKRLSKQLIKSESKALEEVVQQLRSLDTSEDMHFVDFKKKLRDNSKEFEAFINNQNKRNTTVKLKRQDNFKEIIIKNIRGTIRKSMVAKSNENTIVNNYNTVRDSLKLIPQFNLKQIIKDKINFRSSKVQIEKTPLTKRLSTHKKSFQNLKTVIKTQRKQSKAKYAQRQETVPKRQPSLLNIQAKKIHTELRPSPERKKVLSLQNIKKSVLGISLTKKGMSSYKTTPVKEPKKNSIQLQRIKRAQQPIQSKRKKP